MLLARMAEAPRKRKVYQPEGVFLLLISYMAALSLPISFRDKGRQSEWMVPHPHPTRRSAR